MIPETGMDGAAEWLEADGAGGFASGCADGMRTRRYHALLLVATRPPTGRMVLVNGLETSVRTRFQDAPLSSQRYRPDIVHPDARPAIVSFTPTPWPTWNFLLADGTAIVHEVIVPHGRRETILRWRRVQGEGPCELSARPLLSGRDYHALHHENPAFDFAGIVDGGSVVWRPYEGVPAIAVATNGEYRAGPEWYRQFLYSIEQARGLDCLEDLASPGTFTWDLDRGDAVMRLRAGDAIPPHAEAAELVIEQERMRRTDIPPLERSALSYVVERRHGRTVIAGYPWFTDWGRDTFIALRGLLLSTGRIEAAGDVLHEWSGLVSEGMLPNRFPDAGEAPEYNSVDASLWFVVAVKDYLDAAGALADPIRKALQDAVSSILYGYARGTRHGIAADSDGLLRAGEPGVQLTWMDAKVDDWVVTPRIGKPVEVQALWINALEIGAAWDDRWIGAARLARAAFLQRFIDPVSGGLYDVIDVDGDPGRVDARIRPNQIFAVGGLPVAVISGSAARRVVDLVEHHLLTPLGLRTLAPTDPDYVGAYGGNVRQRDGAYHQGTVWPWLMGPFVEAWLRTRERATLAHEDAAERFLAPLEAHLSQSGLGHVSEIADGDWPHHPGGCPFQAWSLGELLRVRYLLKRA